MAEITFIIDGEEYSVEVEAEMGHPRQLYKSGDKVVEKAEREGYTFVGATPEYQELSRAHRKGGSAEEIPLGDISDRVEVADDDRKVDPDSANDEAITIELVGPDGQGIEREYKSSQNLAQVKADLQQYHGIDRSNSVQLYRSTDKETPLDTSKPVTQFDGTKLYWDVTDLR